MTRIKYVSVVEVDGEKRQIRLGKADADGEEMVIPTPDNDVEVFHARQWKRVGVFSLPSEMTKDAFKGWWNDHKDDDPQPSPIPEVLAAMEREVETA